VIDAFAVGPTQAQPSDTEFAQISLLEAECIRSKKRVRELEAELARCTCGAAGGRGPFDAFAGPHSAAPDPGWTVQPPVQPSSAPTPAPFPVHVVFDTAPATSSRLSQLAADLQAARDEVDSKERAMEDLRAEIEELRERARNSRSADGGEWLAEV